MYAGRCLSPILGSAKYNTPLTSFLLRAPPMVEDSWCDNAPGSCECGEPFRSILIGYRHRLGKNKKGDYLQPAG